MDKLNAFFNQNREKLIKGIILLGSIIVIIILISFIVKFISGQKTSYIGLENKLIKATDKYLSDYPELKPSVSNSEVTIDANDLINNKYIKKLNKYIKDTCNAYVVVKYQDNNLDYQAFLNCNNYQTKTFNNVLKNNNATLSQTGEGVYNINNYNVFRGQNPNNYVLFADIYWRIVKYNDEEIYLIIDNKNTSLKEAFNSLSYSGVWDDRYNSESSSRRGINNFALSIAFENIKDLYNNSLLAYQEYLKPYNLCVNSRDELSTNKGGNQECINVIQNQYVGLLPIYDYLNASLSNFCQTTTSPECQNYNYLNNDADPWWTMTPNSQDTYSVYYVNISGYIEDEYASSNKDYRIVIALKGDVLYDKGSGTLEDPYIIR